MWISRGRWSTLSGLVALGALFLVLAAGCSSVSAPRSSGPPVAHGAASLGDPPAPSPSPSLSREEEVVSVVRQFFAALDKAAQTGDTSDLVAVTYEHCPCRQVVATIKQEYSDGGHDVGAHWSVDALTFLSFDHNSAYVQANSELTAYRTINRDGSIRGSYPAHHRTDQIRLTEVAGRWIIVIVDGLSDS